MCEIDKDQLEQVEALAKCIPDAIIILDRLGQIVFASWAIEDILGYTPDELVGHNINILQPLGIQERHNKAFFEYQKTGHKSIDWKLCDTFAQHKNGQEIPIGISFGEYTINDEERYFCGVIRDISKQYHYESELQEREEFFRVLIDSSPVPMAIHMDGSVVYANQAAANLIEADSPTDLIHKKVEEFIHPDSLDQVKKRVKDGYMTGKPAIAVEERFLTFKGNDLWVEVSSVPVRWGGKLATQVIVYDLTRRKKMEEQAWLLSSIIENSEDAIIAQDLGGTILYWNSGAEILYGWAASEIVGSSILTIIPADRHAEVFMVLDRLRKGEKIYHYDTVCRRKGDQLIDVSISTSPIFSKDGKIIGGSSISHNITARKQYEEWALKKAIEPV